MSVSLEPMSSPSKYVHSPTKERTLSEGEEDGGAGGEQERGGTVFSRLLQPLGTLAVAKSIQRCLRKRCGKNSFVAKKCIIHPLTPFRVLWDWYIIVCIMTTLWETPFMVAFYEGDNSTSGWLLFLETSFVVDIALCFFTGRLHLIGAKKTIIMEPLAIMKDYLATDFLLDALAIGVPFNTSYNLFDVLQLLRVGKMTKLMIRYGREHLSLDFLNTIRIIGMVVLLFYCAHFGACAFYYVGRKSMTDFGQQTSWIRQFSEESRQLGGEFPEDQRYIASLYWSMMTVTTVGYGDVSITNDIERMLAVVLMIFFNLLGAIIFGNITNIIASLGADQERFRLKMTQLSEFVKAYEINPAMERRLHDTLAYQWELNRCSDMTDVLNTYPTFLKRDCLMFIHLDFIRKVPFLANTPDGFLRSIVVRLKSELSLPGDIIIHEGDAAQEMYFLREGRVDIFAPQSKRKVASLGGGSFFGEIGLLIAHGRRMNTVTASERCQIFILTKTDLDWTLERFPECKQKLNEAALERLNMVKKQEIKSKWRNSISKVKAINRSSRLMGVEMAKRESAKTLWERERVLVDVMKLGGPFCDISDDVIVRKKMENLNLADGITSRIYIKCLLEGHEEHVTPVFMKRDGNVPQPNHFEYKLMRPKNADGRNLPKLTFTVYEAITIQDWDGGAQNLELGSVTVRLADLDVNKDHSKAYSVPLKEIFVSDEHPVAKLHVNIRRLVLRKRSGTISIRGSRGTSSLSIQNKLAAMAESNLLDADDLSSTSESDTQGSNISQSENSEAEEEPKKSDNEEQGPDQDKPHHSVTSSIQQLQESIVTSKKKKRDSFNSSAGSEKSGSDIESGLGENLSSRRPSLGGLSVASASSAGKAESDGSAVGVHRATAQMQAGRNSVSVKAFESLKDELQSQRSLLLSLNKSIQALLSPTVVEKHDDVKGTGVEGAPVSKPVEHTDGTQHGEVHSTRNSSASKLPSLQESDKEARYLD